jgi:hypothetical protein
VVVAEKSPAPRSRESRSAPADPGDALPVLTAVTGTRPRPEPLDPPMLPFALAGTAVFVVAGVVLLIAGAPRDWLWICLAGALWGIPGTITMLRHDANRRRRRALTHPEFTVHRP